MSRASGPKSKDTCPTCGFEFQVRSDGRIRKHRRHPSDQDLCPGSDALVWGWQEGNENGDQRAPRKGTGREPQSI
jgi:hypothetical protein